MNRKLEHQDKLEAWLKFRLPKDLKDEFMNTCKTNKDIAADVLRDAIKQYLIDATKMKIYTIKQDGDITTVIGAYENRPYIMDINKDSLNVTGKFIEREIKDIYNKYINNDYIKVKE